MRDLKEYMEMRKSIKDRKKEEISIPLYDPHGDYTVPHYKISVNLANFVDNEERICTDFLEKSNPGPDQNNGSYMDAVIEMVVNETKKLIIFQRQEHINMISFPLSKMHRGDQIMYQRELERRKNHLEELKKDLNMVNKVFYRGTVYEELGGGAYGTNN